MEAICLMRHSRFTWSMFLGVLFISCFKNMVHLGRQSLGTTQHKSFLALRTCMVGIQCIGISKGQTYLWILMVTSNLPILVWPSIYQRIHLSSLSKGALTGWLQRLL
uniref:Uncharacterized protein n=1 Tax=Arundo donax TaxID=35708 RepID=A0A0A9G7C8_ARUDO